MSKRPQTPWEDYRQRGGFLHSLTSFVVIGAILVALAFLAKV